MLLSKMAFKPSTYPYKIDKEPHFLESSALCMQYFIIVVSMFPEDLNYLNFMLTKLWRDSR